MTEDAKGQEPSAEETTDSEKRLSGKEILYEFYQIMKNNKKWWLLPIIVILGILCLFISFSEQQQLLPYIYSLL